jgi:hypothetical protein
MVPLRGRAGPSPAYRLSGIRIRALVVSATGYSHRELKDRGLTYSPANAQAFEALKRRLAADGLAARRVGATLLGHPSDTFAVIGYALEFDADAYAVLKRESAE